MHGPSEDVAYSDVQLSRCFRNLGDLATAVEHSQAAMDLYVAQPTYDLENFATCLDVRAHIHELDVNREAQIDGIFLGPALEAAEKTHRQILDVLTSRPVEQNKKASDVMEISRTRLKLHADQRAALTASALDDLSKVLALPPEERGPLLELRVRLLLSLNRLTEATDTASELAQFNQTTMRQGLTAAQAFCRSAARLDPTEPLDDKQRHERETLIDQAIQTLERCVTAGAKPLQLKAEPHFAVLKNDPRFTKLLAENK